MDNQVNVAESKKVIIIGSWMNPVRLNEIRDYIEDETANGSEIIMVDNEK